MVSNNYEKLTYDALLSNNKSDFIFNYNMFILYNIKSKFNDIFKAYYLLIFLCEKDYSQFNLAQYRLSLKEIDSRPIKFVLDLYLSLKMNLYREVEQMIENCKWKEFNFLLQEIKNGLEVRDNIESKKEKKGDVLNKTILDTLSKL